MSVRSAQAITVEFTTSRFDTGAATNADSTPTGTLVKNGTDDAASVTVTNIDTGRYKAAVTLPTLAVGDIVELSVAATVNSVAGKGIVWRDTKDVLLDSNGLVTVPDTQKVDVNTIKTQTITCAAGITVNAFVGNATAALVVDASGRIDLGKWIGVAPLALSSQQVQSIVPDTQKVDVNTIKTQTVTCAAGVTVNVNVGGTQPFNFTGIGASALVKVDTIDMAGQAVTITGTAPDVNVVSITDTVDFTTTMHDSLNQATPAVTVSDKTGFSLANGSIVTATFGVCDFTTDMKTSLNNATPVATLSSAYDFAKGTVAMTEAYAADGSAPTPTQAFFMIWSMLAEKSVSGVTMTTKKLDGTTSAMTFTLDSATTPSSITRAT